MSSCTVPEVATLRIRIERPDVGVFIIGLRTIAQMVDRNLEANRQQKRATKKPRIRYHVIVTELDGTFPRRLNEEPPFR
jgi:hypothetical protein